MKLQDDKIQEAYKKMFSVNEITLIGKKMEKRIQKVNDKAMIAFFKVVAKEFKEAKYGDLGPNEVIQWDKACETVISNWVYNNIPEEVYEI